MPDLPPHPLRDQLQGPLDNPWLVDRVLAGDPRGESPALTELLAALTSPATRGELDGEEAAIAAFTRARSGVSSPPTPARARRLSVLSTFLVGKAVAAAAAGGITIAGTAAAAYTGNLPDALQDVAHQTIGAPAAAAEAQAETPEGSKSSATPVGPDASGEAAYGLCTAWDKGGLKTTSVAYDALVTAAGGEDKVEAYCETLAKPGDGAAQRSTNAPTAPPAKPTARPTEAPQSRPSAPATHATGVPTEAPEPPAAPGGKPTGK